jgi:cell division protein FtsI (penicillin-binding protein 3)
VRPGYDPADDRASPQANWAVYRNGVEVGSTFKPFTVCRALTLKAVGRDERLDMPHEKTFVIGRTSRTIHDAHDAGDLAETGGTVRDLIAQSSNTGTAEISNRMGAAAMRRLFDDLALEQPTGAIGFPAGREGRGAYPKEDGARPWGATDHLVAGFGHLATITPLRLACAFAAFARDDFRPLRPRLVRAIGDDEVPAGEPYDSLCPDARDREVVRDGLRRVVTEGTAAKVFAGCPYAVAGKTGTAKKPDVFGPDRYYSASFCGFAPAEAPRIVVLVMAIEPRLRPGDGAKPYGATVAGPAVRRIVERTLSDYMGIAPSAAPAVPAGTPAPSAGEGPR